jgi:AMMECR1 domain-containing protein
LPGDAWSAEGTKVQLFTAQVFNDQTHPPMPLRFF